MTHNIRVLIADSHPDVRQGLRWLIDAEPDMEAVCDACDGEEAARLARLLSPDVIILDLLMPQMKGVAAIAEIKRYDPDARILVITSFSKDERIFAALKNGALGCLFKDSLLNAVLKAIRGVYVGESSLHPTVARWLVDELSHPPSLPPTDSPLTGREDEVLRLVAGGLSNQDIAQALVVYEGTVGIHVRNILDKLHQANRTRTALYALWGGRAGQPGAKRAPIRNPSWSRRVGMPA